MHGFETDETVGGPGAFYTLFAWSFGTDDIVGNLQVTAPLNVADGDQQQLEVDWGPLTPSTRYLGAISHYTPTGLYGLTILEVDSP